MKVLYRFMDWPLRAKMSALLLIASLVPLGVATLINISQARERITTYTIALLAARSDQLVREIDSFHNSYQRSVDRVAHLPRVMDFYQAGPEESDRLKSIARTVLKVWPASDSNIRGVALLDLSGSVKTATEDSLIGVKLSYHRYVQEAMRGVPVISDVHLAETRVGSAPTIAYLAPIFGPDRKMIGMAVFWVRATALWAIMKATNELAGPGSFAVLFDHYGIRIAHTYSDEMAFHPGGRLDSALVDLFDTENRFGQQTRKLLEDVRPFPEQFDRALAEVPDQEAFRGLAPVNQKWNYGVARRFKAVPWTVFYMIPEESLTAQIDQMIWEKTFFAGIIMLSALLVGAIVTAVILKPVGFLSEATHAIAEGDLTVRVRTVHADELGRLGKSFNAMAERIEAQATSLQKAKERLATIFEISPAGIGLTSLTDGHFIDVNNSLLKLLKLTREEVIGRSSLELGLIQDAQFAENVRNNLRERRSIHDLEVRIKSKTGELRDVLISLEALDLDGEECTLSMWSDITERKRSEVLFQQFLESAPDAVVIADKDGRITLINSQTEKLFGYRREELEGKTVESLIPERFRARHPAHRENYAARPSARPMGAGMELIALRKDRTEFPVEISLSPIETENGMLVISSIRDITERKKSEETIHRWKHIFEHAEWGVVVGSADGQTFEMMNPAFAHMHGYEADELTRAPILTVFAPEAHAGLAEEMKIAHEKGHHTFETVHIRKDGTTFPALVDVTTVRNAHGEVAYRTVNVQDITARKRVENEIRQLNADLEQRVIERTAELRDSLERYHNVLDNMMEGCQIVDFDWRYLYANDAFLFMPSIREKRS